MVKHTLHHGAFPAGFSETIRPSSQKTVIEKLVQFWGTELVYHSFWNIPSFRKKLGKLLNKSETNSGKFNMNSSYFEGVNFSKPSVQFMVIYLKFPDCKFVTPINCVEYILEWILPIFPPKETSKQITIFQKCPSIWKPA